MEQKSAIPQINHAFRAKSKASNEIIDFKLQNLREDMFEAALNLLRLNFVTDETICVAKNLSQNHAVLDEVCYFWRTQMEKNFSIACVLNDGSDELVGVSVLSVMGRNEKFDVKVNNSVKDDDERETENFVLKSRCRKNLRNC